MFSRILIILCEFVRSSTRSAQFRELSHLLSLEYLNCPGLNFRDYEAHSAGPSTFPSVAHVCSRSCIVRVHKNVTAQLAIHIFVNVDFYGHLSFLECEFKPFLELIAKLIYGNLFNCHENNVMK